MSMKVWLIFTKIDSFIENRQIFMLLNCNCTKLANFENFKACLGGPFFVDAVYNHTLQGKMSVEMCQKYMHLI